MNSSGDRWLKRLWLLNGVVLLIFMLFVGGALAIELLSDLIGPDEPTVGIPEAGQTAPAGVRALRLDPPAPVYGASSLLVGVRYGTAFTPPARLSIASGRASLSEPRVNVLFLDPGGSTRLLLESPAYIQRVVWPSEKDSVERWISYEIALADTDGDGRLGEEDDLSLYVTDLDGRSFRRILPEGYSVTWHGAVDAGRSILVYALDTSLRDKGLSKDQLPQRAFLYDVESDSVAPFEAFDREVENAARLLSPE